MCVGLLKFVELRTIHGVIRPDWENVEVFGVTIAWSDLGLESLERSG